MRISVLKKWAAFAGIWVAASALAVFVHASAFGGLAWLTAGLSSVRETERIQVRDSLPLRVRIEGCSEARCDALSEPLEGVRQTVVPSVVRSSARTHVANKPAFTLHEQEPLDDLYLESDANETRQPDSDAKGIIETPSGIERCSRLEALVSRDLWLELRDYGILPRTYKVGLAVVDVGVTRLVRFLPVHAKSFEYLDKILIDVLQQCIDDLDGFDELAPDQDLEVTFVIGDE